jgi:hypothetical protein
MSGIPTGIATGTVMVGNGVSGVSASFEALADFGPVYGFGGRTFRGCVHITGTSISGWTKVAASRAVATTPALMIAL